MDFILIAEKDDKELLGSANATIIKNKTERVLDRRVQSMRPDREYDKIIAYSFSNIYDRSTYKKVRSWSKTRHLRMIDAKVDMAIEERKTIVTGLLKKNS